MSAIYHIISSGGISFLSGRTRAAGDGVWPPSLTPGYNRLASSSSCMGFLPKGSEMPSPLVLLMGPPCSHLAGALVIPKAKW